MAHPSWITCVTVQIHRGTMLGNHDRPASHMNLLTADRWLCLIDPIAG